MAYSRPGVYLTETLLPAPLPGGASANAAGAVVAPFASGPEAVTLVTSWYEFTNKFGGYNAAYPATFQVGAYFTNGGKELYVKRVLHTDALKASVNIETSGNAVVAAVTAKDAGTDGNNLIVVLTAGTVSGTYTLALYKENVAGNILLERYENIVFADSTSSDYAGTVINTVSSYISISNTAAGTPVFTTYPLNGGSNGATVTATDYTNYKGSGSSAFDGFSVVNRPLVIFLPEINQISSAVDVYSAAISWAEDNNGFVIAETPKATSVNNAIAYSGELTASSHVAVYHPHLYVVDPVGRSRQALRLVGPSGAVAGYYMLNDVSPGKGVSKAPAGIGAALLGVVAAETPFTSTELDSMNAGISPVNPIRQIPGAGLSIMGARTLLQDGTANKYVNMRRSLMYIEQSLKNLTEFAIFENNDARLWTRLNTVISVFLNQYRNQGGLRGATAAQAFYVLCDASNNTQASMANGVVNIQVGVALQYPAEFVVINLSQITAA
jgi:uncharacterized protein